MKRCPICTRAFPPGSQRFCPEHGLPLVQPEVGEGIYEGELTGYVVDQRYLLGGVVGRGGMGVVYVAENLRLNRRVAVKVLHSELNSDHKMRMRLFREVRATSQIRHPNVVEIYDYGEDESVGTYLTMEFLDGHGLSEILRERKRLPLNEVLPIAIQLCAGLGATHARGLIHRDLKPSNVRVLTSGMLKILDFGLVRSYEKEKDTNFSTITTAGIAFGTPWYMSPEQASFQPLDPRSDIYSMGIVLYELLVGRPPFQGDNPLELIDAQRKKPVPLPRHLDPPVEIPATIELLLLKMLNKDPERRHQTVAELIDDLYEVARAENISLSDTTVRLGDASAAIVAERDSQPTLDEDAPTIETRAEVVPELTHLQKIVEDRAGELALHLAETLRSSMPRYRELDLEPLTKAIEILVRACSEALGDTDTPLPDQFRRIADTRTEDGFTVTDVLGAFLLGLSHSRELIRDVVGNDFQRYLEIERELDRRILPFYLRMVDYYFAQYNARLTRLNEVLARRNDELNELRQQLTEQVRATSGQLASVERLKAHVLDGIPSGLMLIERGSRNIVVFNKAMEKLCNMAANEVIGRSLDDVLRYFEGVPQAEFVEQIRLHGGVGLRKLAIKLPSGRERIIYVRGEAYSDSKDNPVGTLFMIDDVTERERLIRAFSRYVPARVADRIMRSATHPSGEAERRDVTLISIAIGKLAKLSHELEAEDLAELLNKSLLAVEAALLPHHGVVETNSGRITIVRLRGDIAADEAIDAAVAVQHNLSRVKVPGSDERLKTAVTVSRGKAVFIDIGSDRRALSTLFGSAIDHVLGMQRVADVDNVLVSTELREQANGKYQFATGPEYAVGKEKHIGILVSKTETASA